MFACVRASKVLIVELNESRLMVQNIVEQLNDKLQTLRANYVLAEANRFLLIVGLLFFSSPH